MPVVPSRPSVDPLRVPHPSLEGLADVFAGLEQGRSAVLGDVSGPVPDGSGCGSGPGPWLGLRTSGTTGDPRLHWVSWPELRASAVVSTSTRGWTWATPFRADSYAGVQVGLQAWVSGGRCLALDGGWAGQWALLERAHPEVLSATPTFVDLLVLSEPPSVGAERRWVPRQLTLGGEPLREAVGHRLRGRFPDTRWTVIYASTEAGLIARTHREDGWFAFEDVASRWEESRVEEGRLHLRRAGKWVDTGDRVETGSRGFRVLGRAGPVANVGGTKVTLAEVEALAEAVPGIQQARAVAAPNPVTGEIVHLRYALMPGVEPGVVRADLERKLRSVLRKEAWPRVWERVSGTLGPNAKKGA